MEMSKTQSLQVPTIQSKRHRSKQTTVSYCEKIYANKCAQVIETF